MPLYAYKAMNASGSIVRGRMDAGNTVELEMRLKHLALDFINGNPVGRHPRFQRRIAKRELINFCFHLEQLTRAGVPIIDGLIDLRDHLADAQFRIVLAGIVESIEGGRTLSQAMAEHPRTFDDVMVSLVRAGEDSGQLPEVLSRLVESLKWQDELAAHTQKLLIYPAFLGILTLAIVIFAATYLLPKVAGFMKVMGLQLPLTTALLIGAAGFLADYWLLLAGITGIVLIALPLLIRRHRRVRRWFDQAALSAPVFGEIAGKLILARFAGTFATLYESGITVLDALRTSENIVGNSIIAGGLQRVRQHIADGQNLSGAFQQVGLFPPLVVRMLRIGESTGALDRSLRNAGYFFSRDARESVERLQALMEPMLTLVIGIVMGTVILAVLGPIYDVIARLNA